MADEAAVQRFLRSLIEKGTFLSTIEGVDSIRRAAAAHRDERVVPILSVDGIQRERTILAADTALSALDQLEMVSDNTSISRSAGEILRPDFVFFNRRLGKIVLVELKDAALSERQAVSELLAYEREIRNHFPFIGQMEIVFVLIAREWSDLLTHAYAGLAAHGRPALVGLTISGEAPDYRLRVRSEEGWTRHYHLGIGSDALLSRSYIVRFPQEAADPSLCLLHAADLMRQTADRLAQHGFCLIWARPSEPNALGISVYCVDPAHLLPPAADRIPARRESEFTDFFDKLLSQERIAYQVSLETLVDTLRGALGSSPCVTRLRDGHWDDDLEWLERSGAQPCEFRYWGMLADFSVRVATSPTARRHYGLPDTPGVEAPAAGFQIIAAIIGNQPFKFGRITAKPIFQFGQLLRRAIDLATSNPADRVAWNWNQLRLMPFAVEVIYLAQSWVEPTAPEEPLVMFAPPNTFTALNIMRFGTWVMSLLDDDPLSQVFRAGWQAAEIGAGHRSTCDALINVIAGVKEGECLWTDCEPLLPEEMRGAVDPAQLPEIAHSMPVSWAPFEAYLEVADRWIPYLRRRQGFLEDVAFDLEGLRNGVADMLLRLAPNELPCIAIDADGTVGTAVITLTPELKVPPVNHDLQVAVFNRSLDHDVLAVLNWADLHHGRLTELAKAVVGNPISLEDWRLVDSSAAAVIDNQWREPMIDPNRYGFRPSGSLGARFFRLALSENAPLEIAFVVNTCSTRKQGGWDAEIDFQITSGLIPFRGAKLGFLVLRVETYLLVEKHTLLFDACDRHAHEAIEHLRRQSHIHLIVAREEGEVVAVQQPPNVFEFAELGSGLARVRPGENQVQARRFIVNHRGEIDAMLSVDLIAAVD